MLAIYKRELRAFFTSPIGYVYIAMFLAASSLVFDYFTLLSGTDSSITSFFTVELFICALLTPMLTMRSFSEERKQKTEQLLMTAPITLPGMVLGKFLAYYTMFAISFLISSINVPIALSYLSEANLFRYNAVCALGGCIALFLVGGVFIAIGIFISALSENQMVSGSVTVLVLFILLAVSFLNSYIGFAPIRVMFTWISIYSRFSNFPAGYFDFSALLYYISIMGVCLFLTVRIYEKRRWA